MIVNGWIDWARRRPGPLHKVNGGVNPVNAIIFHSAEGYEAGLWNVLDNGFVSWQLTNLKGGQLVQHYPLSAQCWQATKANNFSVGMEHEGKAPEPLTPEQVLTAQRVVAEISQHYGWTPSRPTSAADIAHTLWEHKEVIRIGGSPTQCPSGRIPWEQILAPPPQPAPTWEQVNRGLVAAAFVNSIGRPPTDLSAEDYAAATWWLEQRP